MSTGRATASVGSATSVGSAALNPPTQLVSGMNDSTTTVGQVDAATATVLALALPEDSTASNHIATARANASRWPSSVRPLIIGALHSVKAFGDEFNSQYDSLCDIAKRIPKEGVPAVAEFKQVVAKLKTVADSTDLEIGRAHV